MTTVAWCRVTDRADELLLDRVNVYTGLCWVLGETILLCCWALSWACLVGLGAAVMLVLAGDGWLVYEGRLGLYAGGADSDVLITVIV